MPNSLYDDLRKARLEQIRAETRHATYEGDYAALKVKELAREQAIVSNNPGEDNVFTYAADINAKTVYQAISTLATFSRRTPGCDITIQLTSMGGSVTDGFALFDYITQLRDRGHKVTIHVLGYAMSMAVTILQAADERVISPNSFLLVHEISHKSDQATFSQHSDALKHSAMMQNKMYKILAERSNLTVNGIKRRATKTDWMMDAEEALKHGLVDRIA